MTLSNYDNWLLASDPMCHHETECEPFASSYLSLDVTTVARELRALPESLASELRQVADQRWSGWWAALALARGQLVDGSNKAACVRALGAIGVLHPEQLSLQALEGAILQLVSVALEALADYTDAYGLVDWETYHAECLEPFALDREEPRKLTFYAFDTPEI